MLRTHFAAAAVALALLQSCSSDARCVPGMTAACACAGGLPGFQMCQANGTYAACDCAGAFDAGRPTRDAGPTRCASDSECDDGIFCNGAERCTPDAAAADVHGCVRAAAPACTGSSNCDETMHACLPCSGHADVDGDGHMAGACGGDDCDDNDAHRYPGNRETCDADGHDEDCDPATLGPDVDMDGYVSTACCDAQPDGSLLCGTDCNDASTAIHPGAVENCNGIDDDCNGLVDDHPLNTFWPDMDGDLRGDSSATPIASCVPPPGTVPNGTDCDDGNAHVYPGALELCDALHDDCTTGMGTFLAEDVDGDMHSPPSATCFPGFPKDDCDDTNPVVYTGAPELCDGLHDDCTGGLGPFLAEDRDGDLHSPIGASCTTGFPKDDCNDTVASIYPGAPETCNGIDDDCDGTIDTFTEACTGAGGCSGHRRCVSGAYGGCVCVVVYPTITLTWMVLEGPSCMVPGYLGATCGEPAGGHTVFTIYVNDVPVGTLMASRYCHGSGGTCGVTFSGSGTVDASTPALRAAWQGDGTDIVRVTKTAGGDYYYMVVGTDFAGVRPTQTACLRDTTSSGCYYSCPDDFAPWCGTLNESWTPSFP